MSKMSVAKERADVDVNIGIGKFYLYPSSSF